MEGRQKTERCEVDAERRFPSFSDAALTDQLPLTLRVYIEQATKGQRLGEERTCSLETRKGRSDATGKVVVVLSVSGLIISKMFAFQSKRMKRVSGGKSLAEKHQVQKDGGGFEESKEMRRSARPEERMGVLVEGSSMRRYTSLSKGMR